ncbi:MAG: hypothetical protein V4599_03415, partial [Verrucomicrobiota bacterium]
ASAAWEGVEVLSGEERTNVEVIVQICTVYDAENSQPEQCPFKLVAHIGDRPGHDRRYAVDASKLQNLCWKPSWSFAEGLRQILVDQLPGNPSGHG